MLDHKKLQRLKELAENATPGPWVAWGYAIARKDDLLPIAWPLAQNGIGEEQRLKNEYYLAAVSPDTVLELLACIASLAAESHPQALPGAYLSGSEDKETALREDLDQLNKEADWLARHALCHSADGRLACPHDFMNITCKPLEDWRREKDARAEPASMVLIDRSTCMEQGTVCWREAARHACAHKEPSL